MRGSVFSKYWILNKRNLLLKNFSENSIKTIKNGMQKQTYIGKITMKISIFHSQHSLPFLSIQKLYTKSFNDNLFILLNHKLWTTNGFKAKLQYSNKIEKNNLFFPM